MRVPSRSKKAPTQGPVGLRSISAVSCVAVIVLSGHDRIARARRQPPGAARGHTGSVDEVELIGGPEKRTVVIEPYNSTWPDLFEEHRCAISDALGAVACRVDHIGSTAVRGLAAKPIIDIQVSVLDVEQEGPYLEPLVAAGYRLRV